MLKKIILSIAILGSIATFAHEGHDKVPGAIKANHGGTVMPGKEINLEYVVSGADVMLFPASHEGSDLSASEVKLNVKSKLPNGKPKLIKLESKEGAFIAKVDFKNAYRIEMTVDTEVKGKKSSFKFQVEK
ncbi:MAG: hypothetical protein B7Y39_04355 [Bdellovibrio sp. 28-41-41]|nr:MAG: hypothetical protein B7Y39_04355 [Bdellovibrio sp. 28-41-41]